jgi:catechol 2,3-dioxygenase-like lactoylglutathione lyase family enzyme
MTDPPIGRVSSIVVDTTSADLEALIAFWKTILGLEEKARNPNFVWLSSISDGGPALAFQTVPEPRAAKNRLHLDVAVANREVFAAHVETLGGSRVDQHTVGHFTWNVMADPAGNEFCIFTDS